MIEKVWPIVGPLIGGGSYISLEEHTSEVATALDRSCGVDGFQLLPEGIRTVATRVQFVTGRAFDSFTVRLSRASGAKTELEKRLNELDDPDLLRPVWVVQAYVDTPKGAPPGSGEVLSVGAIRGHDLYSYLRVEVSKAIEKDFHPAIKIHSNPDDDNGFLSVGWRALENEGRKERFASLNLVSNVWRRP